MGSKIKRPLNKPTVESSSGQRHLMMLFALVGLADDLIVLVSLGHLSNNFRRVALCSEWLERVEKWEDQTGHKRMKTALAVLEWVALLSLIAWCIV